MRVATYNLLHGLDLRTGRVDPVAAARAVAALGADVVAVQEVDRGLARTGGRDQIADLAEALGWHGLFAPALSGDPGAAWRAVAGADPGGAGYGVGLLSATPLLRPTRVALPGGGAGRRRARATPRRPGWDHEPRVAVAADVAWEGSWVRIICTHLSYLPWRGLRQLRAAARAGAGSAAAASGGAVLVGDLNLPVWSVRLALGPAWRHAGGGATYPAGRPRTQPDQLLVTGRLAVRPADVGARGPSDHLPLVATVLPP
ncbi:MAG: endonuclease/exonuclease/phosphatase family protein [Actinobacteria bacterium]|nr:endonuclease/exonuclease/phosphatase family protein [Actinomycetota bacterium]